mmetsp:Transcript_34305/g.73040  ORF Transcript_34305/g.73040 Transcript_34305/m.73040 type:complete len:132 (+) Transcript_34305:33-428(+)
MVPDDLCSPCLCRGTVKYVHRECLQRWRMSSTNGQSSYRCDQCHYNYSIIFGCPEELLMSPRIREAFGSIINFSVVVAIYALFVHTPTTVLFVSLRIVVLAVVAFAALIFQLTTFMVGSGLNGINPSANVG